MIICPDCFNVFENGKLITRVTNASMPSGNGMFTATSFLCPHCEYVLAKFSNVIGHGGEILKEYVPPKHKLPLPPSKPLIIPTTARIQDGTQTQIRIPVEGVCLVCDVNGTPAATDVENWDGIGDLEAVMTEAGDLLYEVGQVIEIKKDESAEWVDCVRILKIRREDVRKISNEDGSKTGFVGFGMFFRDWIIRHDPDLLPQWTTGYSQDMAQHLTESRPAALYDAWVLDIELVG